MFTRTKILCVTIALIFLGIVSPSYADQLIKMSVQDMVSTSQVIVLGKVRSISKRDCPEDVICANVSVEHVLKGNPPKTVLVTVGGMIIAEAKPLCCRIGATYLFYLQPFHRPGTTAMESVDGKYGIVKWSEPAS